MKSESKIWLRIILALPFLNIPLIVLAQLEPSDLPPELKYIVETDLDTWEPPQEISKNYPYYLSGYDSENRPIWILEFGKWDIRSLVDKGEEGLFTVMDKHVDKAIWNMYNSTGARATPEKPVKTIVGIIDLEGYDLRQLNSARSVKFIIKAVTTLTTGFHFAHGVYLVNTNIVAQNLINLLRPILGPNFAKLQIFGTNPAKYWPVLLKDIPKDQLPKYYGGIENFKPQKIYG